MTGYLPLSDLSQSSLIFYGTTALVCLLLVAISWIAQHRNASKVTADVMGQLTVIMAFRGFILCWLGGNADINVDTTYVHTLSVLWLATDIVLSTLQWNIVVRVLRLAFRRSPESRNACSDRINVILRGGFSLLNPLGVVFDFTVRNIQWQGGDCYVSPIFGSSAYGLTGENAYPIATLWHGSIAPFVTMALMWMVYLMSPYKSTFQGSSRPWLMAAMFQGLLGVATVLAGKVAHQIFPVYLVYLVLAIITTNATLEAVNYPEFMQPGMLFNVLIVYTGRRSQRSVDTDTMVSVTMAT
jgi:hypothetical protein